MSNTNRSMYALSRPFAIFPLPFSFFSSMCATTQCVELHSRITWPPLWHQTRVSQHFETFIAAFFQTPRFPRAYTAESVDMRDSARYHDGLASLTPASSISVRAREWPHSAEEKEAKRRQSRRLGEGRRIKGGKWGVPQPSPPRYRVGPFPAVTL